MKQTDKRQKIELLAPAGNYEKLQTVFHFGADAAYLGGKLFGLRQNADNFDVSEMSKAKTQAEAAGKKIYATVNVFAHNRDLGGIDRFLAQLEETGVDGVIVSDLGVIDLARKKYPKLGIHVSTQANTTNKAAARFYAELGAKRIVLARELTLPEISEIREALPDSVELEAFVHGAMCISYSGRCLLSNYLSNRDSNGGACVQACRWEYQISEKSRKGSPLGIEEDARGAYILNSKDLCMIEHLDKLIKAGVTSLKIEGRNKSAYYAAVVTNAYKRALDAYFDSPNIYTVPAGLTDELQNAANRTYSTGFYLGEGGSNVNLDFSAPRQASVFCAVVREDGSDGRALIEMRNRFFEGSVLDVLSPTDSFCKKITVAGLTDISGARLAVADHVQQPLYLYTDVPLKKGDMLRTLI